MNYIWDIVLNAKQNGIKKNELFFQQGIDVSAYYEQSFPCLDQQEVDCNIIEINALYRFDNVFAKYLHSGFSEHLEFKKYFYDLVIHFLCEIDLRKGLSRESLHLLQIEDEIMSNLFGVQMKENFSYFSVKDKDMLIPLVLKQISIDSSLLTFRKALTAIYPDVLLYQLKEEPSMLLIYLGITEKEVCKMQFIIDMFLPLEFETRIFWDKHFGVCGVEATLVLGEIVLI